MKRKSGRLVVLLGLLLLVVLLVGGYLYLSSQPGGLGGAPPPTVVVLPRETILVASKFITAGTYIEYTEGWFTPKEITPTAPLSDDVVRQAGQVLKKRALVDIPPDEMLLKSMFGEPGLAYEIAAGKRAMPIRVDRYTGVVGRIAKRDRVDVILSGTVEEYFMQKFPLTVECPPTAPGECWDFVLRPFPQTDAEPFELRTVKTVIQKVRVLEVITLTAELAPGVKPTAAPTQGGPAAAPTLPSEWIMILEVSDLEAEVLRFGIDQGWVVQLLLRPYDDESTTDTDGVTTWILLDPAGRYNVPIPRVIPHPVAPGDLPEGVIPWVLRAGE